jgi:xanthine dehydrogenase accessory factor
MREVIDDITRWLIEGASDIVLATVLTTWGSAPRKAGAKMAFTAGGAAISGSVSGGCVEGAVIEAGGEVLADGRPRLLRFGVADETAWGVGLACGGTIEVLVEQLDQIAYVAARRWIDAGTSGALLTAIAGPDERLGDKAMLEHGRRPVGPLASALDADVIALAEAARTAQRVTTANGIEIFIDPIRPSPSLVIIGGAHIAVALARLAKVVGYRTVVIDPRRAFGSAARFPDVDRLVPAWPDKALAEEPLTAESAVVTLSHDPKIDDPALRAALSSDAFYIGALGSRPTHAARRQRLAALGFSDAQLARIHAPIGLDIGAQTPEEIAVAILAQVISVQYSVGQ